MDNELLFQILNTSISLAVAIMVISQLKQLKLSLNSSAQISLYNQNADVRKHISSEPEVYPYFFEGEELTEETPQELQVKVKMTALMYLSYFENLVTQEKNLHKKHRQAWANTFVKQSIQKSPVMKQILNAEKDVYVQELRDCCIE